MSSAKSIVVNCGASHLTYAVYTNKGSSTVIEELFVEPLNYDYSDDEGWLSAVTDRLRIILSRAKNKGDATLIAPGYQLLTKTIKVPHVEKEKQSQIIAFEAQNNIPYPLSEVVWGHQVISDDGVEAEVILIAFKSLAAARFCNTVASLGLRPVSVQASSILDYNAFHSVYPQVSDTTLLINIGARSSSLLFISPEGFFVRNIALGGNTLTQNIGDQLGQTFLQAEQLKTSIFSGEVEYDENDGTQAIVWQAAEGFVRRMGQEISRSIVNYKRAKKGQAPTMILLTGRGSLIPGLSDQLSHTQQVAVDYFDPTQKLTAGSRVNATILQGYYYQLSEVLGYACAANMPDSVGVELLPPFIAKQLAFKRKKPVLMAAALCLPLAPLLPALQVTGQAGTYEEARQKIDETLPEFRSNHSKIIQNQELAQQIYERIQQLQILSESRANWVTFFADLQERLVAQKDVWIDTLDVERTTPTQPRTETRNNNQLAATPPPPQPVTYKLKLGGRMLLRAEGTDKIGLDPQVASRRVRSIIESITRSEFIQGVDGLPEFDASNPRVLKFSFTLVVNPEKPL